MRIPISLVAVAMSCTIAGVAAGQTAPAASPRSLAGDWDSTVNPQAKLVLHLYDAGGALSGTIDVPGSPPKRIVLGNTHLAGNLLTFTMPPMQSKVMEVILPGAKKMAGPYMWVKEGTPELPPPPPFEPLSQLAGDWESPGGGPSAQVLRLRLAASGALTGTIDVPEPMAARQWLKNVEVRGRLLSYTLPDGVHTYQGAFSRDGNSVEATGMSTIDGGWHHVRTAAQAAAVAAAASADPANGDWSGTGEYTANFPGIGIRKGTATLTFHFRGNPDSCVVKLEGNSDSPVPCRMTVTGNTVRIENVIGYGATFNGTLSADKNHLSGNWMMGKAWNWTGPMHLDLSRVSPAH
jgi:hypothetical protein